MNERTLTDTERKGGTMGIKCADRCGAGWDKASDPTIHWGAGLALYCDACWWKRLTAHATAEDVEALRKILPSIYDEDSQGAAAEMLVASDWLAVRVAVAVDRVEVERQAEEDRANENATLVHQERAARLALVVKIEALIAANERTAPGAGGAIDAGINAADRAWRRELRGLLAADDTEGKP